MTESLGTLIVRPSRHRHGLVIGKFYPPHLGHHRLISDASAQVDRLTVLVLASATETIPLADRVSWLCQVHAHEQNVRVIGSACDVPMDLGSESVWAAHVAIMKAAVRAQSTVPVDVVFSSEAYGDELAARFGADSVLIDPGREVVPISSTRLRQDLAGAWAWLHPVVKSALTTRVVVLGAESTGTTTMAETLRDHFVARGGVWRQTRLVSEYGRDYTAEKLRKAQRADARTGRDTSTLESLVWDEADFVTIAAVQEERENEAAANGSPVLVCDTDALATSVWRLRYLGRDRGTDRVRPAGTCPPDRRIYFLTSHEGVPFVQDGWRDGQHIRAQMTDWFIRCLTELRQSWVLLTGGLQERTDLAVSVAQGLLTRNACFSDPLGFRSH